MHASIAGIDLGKKLAGTTVISYVTESSTMAWAQASKNEDADAFIRSFLKSLPVKALFMDAPLSLPGVYRFGKPYEDYFYRKGDRALGAMSPMFLAGLTARAIRLKDQLEAEIGLTVYEAYPKALAQILALQSLDYKGQKAAIPNATSYVANEAGLTASTHRLPDWHHVDALLALTTGLRWLRNDHQVWGNEEEGAIFI